MVKNSSPPDRYALVGHPVEHSRSPLIHQLFARQTGQDLTYELIDAEPKSFETAVRGFAAAGGRGLNVTVPHKEAAFALVDEISEPAHAAHAVNTITFAGGKLRGENTDGVGLIRDLVVNQRVTLPGRRVLVLGAGGAARGIVGPLLAARPAELVIANRTKARADELVEQFDKPAALKPVAFEELPSLAAFDLLINATSAGLRGEPPPFPASLVGGESVCYDLVYSVNDTPFVAWAREHGAARALQGWGMLIEQAAESFFIWRGVRPDTKPILKQLVR
ncbi:MAG TPA: shikimate dehydrogenase [Gammaproteobacteria bacterium]|jgi:shikimate dehydrogenase|nr:shikimate dehydrogenase [Gammaproteobacteria bacterium]